MFTGDPDPKMPATPPTDATPRELSDASAAEVAVRVAGLTAAGAPLPAGLIALAADWPDRRVAGRLREMARRLTAGQSFQESLAALGIPTFERLLADGASRGRAAQVLNDCLQFELQRGRRRRELTRAFAYPLILLAATLIWLYFLLLFVAPMFESIIRDFSIHVAALLEGIFWLGRLGWWRLAALLLSPLLVVAAARLILGRRLFFGLCERAPLLGPILKWRDLITWGGTLRILIGHRAPLDEALLAAGAGARGPRLANASRRMAEGVREGRALSLCARLQDDLPATLAPLLAWGEKSQTMAEAFGIATEYWNERLASSLRIARSVLTPIVFGVVVLVPMTLLFSFLYPLGQLIRSLSM